MIFDQAVRDFTSRDAVVIATEVWAAMRRAPTATASTREAILSELDHSLQRLGTDYVDLYQIHRYDYETPRNL